MTGRWWMVIGAVTALCVADARGQANQREPHIGYLFPGGGRQGTTFRVTIGGQRLRNPQAVYIFGEGVRATVVGHYPPMRNLNREQREQIARRMRAAIELRWDELADKGLVTSTLPWERFAELGFARPRRAAPKKADAGEEVEVPPHPLLDDLETKSLRELLHVRSILSEGRKRRQQNNQIAETVVIEVTIDRDAAPGDRELRLETRQGMTNPMTFQVGVLPETFHLEPDEQRLLDFLPDEPPPELPIVVNGQIMPGDADRIRFRAREGQQLVIEAHARRLIPYLADAVPGWFQATLTLYDAQGEEVAYADDYRFDPDPVVLYVVPVDGEYALEIRDSIYRGREDFVYRISIGEEPFITHIFPLGGRAGRDESSTVGGWNLKRKRWPLDTRLGSERVRHTMLERGDHLSNPVTYAVDMLADYPENEVNDTLAQARRIGLPRIMNGCIDRPGDVDTFRLHGAAGDEIVVDVMARRLRSPLDSLLRLLDANGDVLAWNDDFEHKDGFLHTDMGELTHHADSYLRYRLPKGGAYFVQLTDSQGHGGEAYGYRLRIGPPRPDFALYMTPSSINVPAGRAAVVDVYVARADGFDGAVDLVLKDAPAGFKLDGARVPVGRDHVRMTLTAPTRRLDAPATLELESRATIRGKEVTRRVVPAENMMQAFLYRHLVPVRETMVSVTGGRGFGQSVELAGDFPIQIPFNGSGRVRVRIPRGARTQDMRLELDDPPPGVTLRQIITAASGRLEFEVSTDGSVAAVGYADNLIVEAFNQPVERDTDDNTSRRARRTSLGYLPAIPFEVVPE